jgi:chromosome segregation ATPase
MSGIFAPMKPIVGVIIVGVVLCLGLGVALFKTNRKHAEEKARDTETISTLSNKWVETDGKWNEQKQVNATLEKDLETRKQEFATLSNKFTDVSGTLVKTEGTVKELQQTLQLSKEDIAKRDAKIADLEKQNHDLDLRAADLSTAITNLTTQIAETQRKLSASEGDKAFLETELKRLMGEKAELERQFNDLAIVRAQVAKLREELNIARRLEWIRKGLFAVDQQKGATRLLDKNAPTPPATNHYDLNVEVNADGSVRVIPPLTNAPAPAQPQPQ